MMKLVFPALIAAAIAAAPTNASAGACCSKPPPPANPPSAPNGHAAATVQNQNAAANQAAYVKSVAEQLQKDGLEIKAGDYLTRTSGSITFFDGVLSKDLINTIELAQTGATGKAGFEAELVKRGVTVLPTDAQMKALQAYRDNGGASLNVVHQIGEWEAANLAHNIWAQNEINARNPSPSQYGRVTPQDWVAEAQRAAGYDPAVDPLRR